MRHARVLPCAWRYTDLRVAGRDGHSCFKNTTTAELLFLPRKSPLLEMRRGSVMTDPDEDERELEYSPLCADETREGITLRVEIYRFAGSGEGWSLLL